MHTTMRRQKNNWDCIIIGGGASGLAAACVAGQAGKRVLVVEKNSKPGKKLLATGNGRCNLGNVGEPRFFGDADFARRVLSYCGQSEVLRFFASLGVRALPDDMGRLYPVTGKSETVVEALTWGLRRAGVTMLLSSQAEEVTPLEQGGAGYAVTLRSGETHAAPCVLLAGGGMAAPKLGGCDDMARMAAALGFDLTERLPALCALDGKKNALKPLSGLRLKAVATLLVDGEAVDAASGEVLFADSGVSGVCVMQLARACARPLRAGRKAALSLDFAPALGVAPCAYARQTAQKNSPYQADVLELLEARAFLPRERLLTGLVPAPLDVLLNTGSAADTARAVTHFAVPILALRGFDHAQVTQGGVATRGIDPKTMQTALPGLYMAGEMLDVDGDTGGHNLLFAFAGGLLAGRAMGRA